MPYRPPRRSVTVNNQRNKPQYRGDWPTRSRAAIAAHRAQHGDVCPGWRHPPHVIHRSEWTCDHELGPLCRSCNSRKGVMHDRPKRE